MTLFFLNTLNRLCDKIRKGINQHQENNFSDSEKRSSVETKYEVAENKIEVTLTSPAYIPHFVARHVQGITTQKRTKIQTVSPRVDDDLVERQRQKQTVAYFNKNTPLAAAQRDSTA